VAPSRKHPFHSPEPQRVDGCQTEHYPSYGYEKENGELIAVPGIEESETFFCGDDDSCGTPSQGATAHCPANRVFVAVPRQGLLRRPGRGGCLLVIAGVPGLVLGGYSSAAVGEMMLSSMAT
jgi:hypothetical protein